MLQLNNSRRSCGIVKPDRPTDMLCVGITHTRSNAAVKRGAWRTGVGERD